MSITEFCIKRPVFTIVLSLILIIVGVIGFNRLQIRNLPEINKPVVSIHTNYSGASAKLVENSITTPLEDVVSTINGLDKVSSDSKMGESSIHLEFKLGTNIDNAVSDVRNKVSTVVKRLPKGSDAPIIRKADVNARPTLMVSFTDPNKNSMELADYLNRYVAPTLEQVDGVSLVNIWGKGQYAMRIWLNPTEMAAKKVTANDVIQALEAQNVNIPAGQIKSIARNYTIFASSKLSIPAQFAKIVVRQSQGALVRLGDVAKVKVGSDNPDSAMRVNGLPTVGAAIVPDTTANPIIVSKLSRKALKRIAMTLPSGMQYKIIFDRSNYIHASINDVLDTIIIAILLVVLVVLGFLGSIRSAMIPIVTIPVCLLATFGLLYLFGYTINTITLLAMVLAIGLVVDDAIVVLENIYRHMENGLSRMQASIKGSREIVFAIIAMTVTLAAVYAPIGFIHGVTGKIFQPFAFTLAGAVIVSGFVALTLSPMMCSKMLASTKTQGRYANWVDTVFTKLVDTYKRTLESVLHYRRWVVVTVVVIAAIGFAIFKLLPAELAPPEDEGAVIGIITAPNDSSFDYTDRYAKQVEALYSGLPGVENYFMNVGDPDNEAFSIVVLKPWGERPSQQQVAQELAPKMRAITGVDAFPVSPSPLGIKQQGNHALRVMIMTTGTYDSLNKTMQSLVKKLSDYPGLVGVDHQMKMNSSQYEVKINRDLAAEMHVSMTDIAQAMSVMMGGDQSQTFDYGGESYKVIVQMADKNLRSLAALQRIYVRNSQGEMLPLSSVVTGKSVVGPLDLRHYNRMRSDVLTAELAPGYDIGQVVTYLESALPNDLPDSDQFAFSGAAKQYLESSGRMGMAFGLALIFIYLVLAAQFESFVDPAIVMVSVPLCIVGALFVLWLTSNSLNIYSNIGLVTLIGLIAKHGILITEFANQLRAEGKDKMDAIMTAAALRLRPILMTTAAMVLGAIPLAFASGAGAAARHQVGWVIVGGMLFGTFFSLFVVPVGYSYLAQSQKK